MEEGKPIKLELFIKPYNKSTKERNKIMRVIGILLIILGIIGIFMGMMMFGDIGIACIVGALAALLSGIGFLITAKNV